MSKKLSSESRDHHSADEEEHGTELTVFVTPDTVGIQHTTALRPGSRCPKCKSAVLDYDGMLNLSCPRCGTIEGGCFT